jgi:4-hydroxy-3-methylbut-2-en-1-yl diphosphate synthase IspG/GcpE
MVEAYRQLSEVTDVPLPRRHARHRMARQGHRSITTLLMEGIGDAIRYSLTAIRSKEAAATNCSDPRLRAQNIV